jgi:hypothetical protein
MGEYSISRPMLLVRANEGAEIDAFQLSDYDPLSFCYLPYVCVQDFKTRFTICLRL